MRKIFALVLFVLIFSSIVSAKVTGRFTITGEATKNNIEEEKESIFDIIKDFFKKIFPSPVYGRFEVSSTPSVSSEGAGGGGERIDKGVPKIPSNIPPEIPENITKPEIPEKKPELIEIFRNKFLILFLLLLIILIIIIVILTRKKKTENKRKRK